MSAKLNEKIDRLNQQMVDKFNKGDYGKYLYQLLKDIGGLEKEISLKDKGTGVLESLAQIFHSMGNEIESLIRNIQMTNTNEEFEKLKINFSLAEQQLDSMLKEKVNEEKEKQTNKILKYTKKGSEIIGPIINCGMAAFILLKIVKR